MKLRFLFKAFFFIGLFTFPIHATATSLILACKIEKTNDESHRWVQQVDEIEIDVSKQFIQLNDANTMRSANPDY